MDPAETSETNEEFRVRVTSKRKVTEHINKQTELLRKVLDGQTELSEETKRVLLQELQANFEAAIQDNVLVNGKPWEEAPDDEESEAVNLESLLDDTIVETARKRRTYPRKILPHVLRSLKAERKIMGLYEQTVKPSEVIRDPERESIMSDLSAAAAPVMVKQAVQVIKSIHTLQKQAEGLCEVLNMTQSLATTEVHKEVFGSSGQSDAALPPVKGGRASRQPIKRAVEEAAEANCYVPPSKKPAAEEKPE